MPRISYLILDPGLVSHRGRSVQVRPRDFVSESARAGAVTIVSPPPVQGLHGNQVAAARKEKKSDHTDRARDAAVPIFALVLSEVVTTPSAALSSAALQLPGAPFQFWQTAKSALRSTAKRVWCCPGFSHQTRR